MKQKRWTKRGLEVRDEVVKAGGTGHSPVPGTRAHPRATDYRRCDKRREERDVRRFFSY